MRCGNQERSSDKRIKGQFYGTVETQLSEGGEADLHKHLVGCKKNPGHRNFVPVNDFNITHLPEDYQDEDIVKLIKATADLTVRVDVRITSTERPEFWPDTNIPYAFYNIRGSDVMRIGTGMVWRVFKYDNEPCQCQKCQHSDTPSEVWGEVFVDTTNHVLFDDFEAKHTRCRLFYDRQDSPLVILKGSSAVKNDLESDWCEFKCVTCDVDLLDKLFRKWRNRVNLWRKIIYKYRDSENGSRLCFIVSHPHGCPKQVSVGRWLYRLVVDYGIPDNFDYNWEATKYTYTACTCPGSSGAYVHLLADTAHFHSGVNSEGTNFSGTGGEWFPSWKSCSANEQRNGSSISYDKLPKVNAQSIPECRYLRSHDTNSHLLNKTHVSHLYQSPLFLKEFIILSFIMETLKRPILKSTSIDLRSGAFQAAPLSWCLSVAHSFHKRLLPVSCNEISIKIWLTSIVLFFV